MLMTYQLLRFRSLLAGFVFLSFTTPAHADLDLAFLLDTTGSMSNEIRQAKERVQHLADSLRESRPGQRVRIGVVAFRDRGDDYLTLISPLDENVESSFRFLAGLTAGGGGDRPEDVLAGISAAIHELRWDHSEGVERQVFLIGDAPPHLDYSDGPDLAGLVATARERGIVFNSIGCRNLRTNGIRFFQDLAYGTEGVYQHIGRVRSHSKGLTEAMLKTLKPKNIINHVGDTIAVVVRWEGIRGAPEGSGVLVRYGDCFGGTTCQIELSLPAGLGLGKIPVVRKGPASVEVQLSLTQGTGGRYTYAIAPCVSADAPIHINFGER